MYRKNFRRKGFTLIELAAVAIIVAILSSIAVTQLAGSTSYTAKARLVALTEQLNSAQSIYLAETLQPEVTPVSTDTDKRAAACAAYLVLRPYLPAMQAYASLDSFEASVYEKLNTASQYTVVYEKNNQTGKYAFKAEEKSNK